MSPPSAHVADDREWVSFDDQEGNSWMFDATMLNSNWRCIWNDGCPGIEAEPAPELLHGCCSHGAHFTGDDDRERVLAQAARLSQRTWARHGEFDSPLIVDDEGETTTRVVDGACVFHNPVGFDAGPGCALHIGAVDAAQSPIDWKPEVCWQLPLRLEHHVDDNEHNTYFVREWHRRHWGEGGADLGWWCTEASEAFAGHEPMYVTLEAELRALVGDAVYDKLCDRFEQAPPAPLPHPAVRNRR